MNGEQNNGCFSTEDLLLASYLDSKRIPLLEVEAVDSWRAMFIFKDSEALQEMVNEWTCSSPVGNIKAAFRSFHYLKRQARAATSTCSREVAR